MRSAETQGSTDRYISTWLRGKRREDLVLATKVAGYGNKYLRKSGEQTRITAQQVEESVNGSLARLGTDYIDLLQVSNTCSRMPRHGLAPGAMPEHPERPV